MTLENLAKYYLNPLLAERFMLCQKFITDNDLSTMPNDKYAIDGDNVFVTIMDIIPSAEDTRVWEAHKEYIDIHYILSGCERIKIGYLADMEMGEYTHDVYFGEGTGVITHDLYVGDSCICSPDDVHKVGILLNGVETYRKAVFKIKVN